jgi:hypothetical protein
MIHYDGGGWSTMGGGVSYDLNGVWGSSPTDVYAVGALNTILHYDGSSWSTMSSGDSPSVLYAIWGSSATDVFVGGTQSEGYIFHYDGSSWSPMDTGYTGVSVSGLWGTSPAEVFAAGGYILKYDGDPDGDLVPDPDDNCPNTHNPSQADADGNGMGDACDPDGYVAGLETTLANMESRLADAEARLAGCCPVGPLCGDGKIQWNLGETCDPPGSICGSGGNPAWQCTDLCRCVGVEEGSVKTTPRWVCGVERRQEGM